jgi:hypothetical protein
MRSSDEGLLANLVPAIRGEANGAAGVVDVCVAPGPVVEHVRPRYERELAAAVGQPDESREEHVERPSQRPGGERGKVGADLLDRRVDGGLPLHGRALRRGSREEALDVVLRPVQDAARASGQRLDVGCESPAVLARVDGQRLLREEGGEHRPLLQVGVRGAELGLRDRALHSDQRRLRDVQQTLAAANLVGGDEAATLR